MTRPQPISLLAVSVLSAAGCTLSTYDYAVCESNAQCQTAFGWGSTCGDEGLCETVTLTERCETLYPFDLELPVSGDDYFLLGTIFDHSLASHEARYRSVELAAIQANDNGGLDGRGFAILHCNNEPDESDSDPVSDGLDKDAATEEIALWLSDTLGLPAIVGPSSSSRTEAAYNAISGHNTLLISPSASSPSLTPLDGTSASDEDPGLLWRTAAPDDFQGAVIAEDMLGRALSDVGVIYQTGAYGEGLQVVFIDAFTGAGGQATGYPFSDSDLSESIIDAGGGDHEAILFISSESDDVVSFLNAVALLDSYQGREIFLTDSAKNVDVLDQVSEDARELFPFIRGTAPSAPSGPVYDAFVASYAGNYNGDDVSVLSYTAHSFDAAWLTIYGAAWATYQEGAVGGVEMARGLRQISAGEAVDVRPSFWNTIKASFQYGEGVDISGASGELNYDPVTGETTAPIDIWQISREGDDFEILDTLDPG